MDLTARRGGTFPLSPNALRREMGRRGLLQRDLAELAGVAESTLSEILTGRRAPVYRTALKIAQALHDRPPDPLLSLLAGIPMEQVP